MTRSLGSTFGAIAGWLAAIAGGVLLFTVGIVLLIVGIVRRHNATVPPLVVAHAIPIAPGWYPDPATPALWRYHDGARWTENTAPRR